MKWMAHRFGYRGSWLLFVGAAWLVFGVGVLVYPEPDRSFVLFQMVPDPIDAVAWISTGTIAIWQGVRRPTDDWLGHAALIVMPVIRSMSFMVSFAAWVCTHYVTTFGYDGGVFGYATAWYPALLWGLVVLLVVLGGRWPDPQVVIPHPPTVHADE